MENVPVVGLIKSYFILFFKKFCIFKDIVLISQLFYCVLFSYCFSACLSGHGSILFILLIALNQIAFGRKHNLLGGGKYLWCVIN